MSRSRTESERRLFYAERGWTYDPRRDDAFYRALNADPTVLAQREELAEQADQRMQRLIDQLHSGRLTQEKFAAAEADDHRELEKAHEKIDDLFAQRYFSEQGAGTTSLTQGRGFQFKELVSSGGDVSGWNVVQDGESIGVIANTPRGAVIFLGEPSLTGVVRAALAELYPQGLPPSPSDERRARERDVTPRQRLLRIKYL